MKLRSQLLLISLCILVLPWAGCQYIREMEQVLLDGQARELEARGQAIAAHLRSQADKILLSHNQADTNPERQLFFHALPSTPNLDGYFDDWPVTPLNLEDWQLESIDPVFFSGDPANDSSHDISNNKPARVSVTALCGTNQNNGYLFFTIFDDAPRYHNPQQAGLVNGDHLLLRIGDGAQNTQTYLLRANGQGPFSARYVNQQGNIRQEHRIRGFWRGTNQGYAIELFIPQNLLGTQVDFAYRKTNGASLGTYAENLPPQPWINLDKNIAAIIQLYGDQQTQIDVVNSSGWLLAHAGRLREINYDGPDSIDWQWFLSALYRLALGDMQLPAMEIPLRRGRMESAEVKTAISGASQTQWYQQGSQRIARTAVPINLSGQIVGAVAVSQSTDSLVAGTNSAFNRLFYYMAIAIGVVAISLFAYATILSFRIRRLSKAADDAIGEDGKIKTDFIRSGFGDEIGDLTRSYGQLLSRLRDYTDYLRTLASKLSHELRTPLAVVRSSLENLDHPVDDNEATQYRQRAKEGAERLGNILAAMSSASQMEDSIQHTPTETFSLDKLLSEVTAAYKTTYSSSYIKLDIVTDADYTMHGSPDLIVQMLDKLVDNAVDFCPMDGEIKLELQRSKNTLHMSVSNTGPLLPEHMQGQLFDSLVSVRESGSARDSNSRRQKTHLGLGLYIVRLIVDFHRGAVQARNLHDGSGVCFDIYFPA